MLLNCGAAEDSWASLGQQRDQTVNLKGSQLWIFIGRTDVEAEAPVFWSPYVNNQLIGKVPDVGKDWGQKEKRASEDEMTEWHHWCNGLELGQTPGDGEGQGGMACCNPRGQKNQTLLGTTLGITDKMEAKPQTPLLIPQAQSQDEGVRPCNSDLSFPLLGWADWKGILRRLLFLRGAWEGTKPSAALLRK